MSEKIKGIYGSETRADEVLEWLKSQGADTSSYSGNSEDNLYFVKDGEVRIFHKHFSYLFDIVELPRWRAKKGETYCYITDYGEVDETTDEKGYRDEERYRLGNYFKSWAEAEQYAEKIREIFKRKE